MRIHIGWAIAGCAVSVAVGVVLGLSRVQDVLDTQLAGVVIEHRMADFKVTNQAYIALESGDSERAKRILMAQASKNYGLIKEIREVMGAHVHGLLIQPKLKQADLFLEQQKSSASLQPSSQAHASNPSFEWTP